MHGVMDKACVDERPDECVDCGACEPVCPVDAIYYDDLPAPLVPYLADNADFFAKRLPGLDAPLGSPGAPPALGRSRPTRH